MATDCEFDLNDWSLDNLSHMLYGEPFDPELLERRLEVDRRRQRLNPRPYLRLVVNNAACLP